VFYFFDAKDMYKRVGTAKHAQAGPYVVRRTRPENFPNVNDYRNLVIAEAMKVLSYVNRSSRGVARVREEMLDSGNGLAVFDFSKLSVFEVVVTVSIQYQYFTNPVILLLKFLSGGNYSSGEMRTLLGIKHRGTFRDNYIHTALSMGLNVQTIPEKPNSRLQKYKLAERAKHYLDQ
jgi:ATP-dependent DNA helicase RecG